MNHQHRILTQQITIISQQIDVLSMLVKSSDLAPYLQDDMLYPLTSAFHHVQKCQNVMKRILAVGNPMTLENRRVSSRKIVRFPGGNSGNSGNFPILEQETA